MRFYTLLNFQHIALYVFPALVFMVIFFLGLGYSHFRTQNSHERLSRINHRFPEGIEERNAPFPIVLMLIIAGTIIWGFLYILGYGMLEVQL
jgi:hypothetical protein